MNFELVIVPPGDGPREPSVSVEANHLPDTGDYTTA
jgi:hypothetical protein